MSSVVGAAGTIVVGSTIGGALLGTADGGGVVGCAVADGVVVLLGVTLVVEAQPARLRAVAIATTATQYIFIPSPWHFRTDLVP